MREFVWIAMIFVLLWFMGKQERDHAEQVGRIEKAYDRQIDQMVMDNYIISKEVLEYKAALAMKDFKANMPAEEFMEIMADYLARDGRCEVEFHTHAIDWSDWSETYSR